MLAAVDGFARFAEAAAPVHTEDVERVCTLNEPNMIAALLPLLTQTHRRAVEVVKSRAPHVRTGWSVAVQAIEARPGGERVAEEYGRSRQDVFLHAAQGDDWLGIQTCTRVLVGLDGALPVPDGAERTLTGREFHPGALGATLRRAAALAPGRPPVVTENGIATDDDTRRVADTAEALTGLVGAMADGVDVRGYFHWSALDTYEWGSYRPTFGLVAVDRTTFVRTTFVRTTKPSAARPTA
ncbi:family 1 glycosylhydrolase [Streptomyces sp. LaBMicrA B280]|uniref:family 1 glycosylhydrolase n=1 Tax=Streptomyces sp. LaBMicrA B280 TaxID=3391001 RepID=UPI003BA45B25